MGAFIFDWFAGLFALVGLVFLVLAAFVEVEP